jgi:type IV pilus assembly protein PilO
MLRQLPGQTEVDNLLIDISQAALAAGLEQELFQPQREVRGTSTPSSPSACASPAATTIRDLREQCRGAAAHRDAARHHHYTGSGSNLTMELTAKTYRYVEEGDGQ